MQIPAEKHKAGRVWHTVGYPLPTSTYGGSFLYHMDNNQVALGYVRPHPNAALAHTYHIRRMNICSHPNQRDLYHREAFDVECHNVTCAALLNAGWSEASGACV